jgi:hypothetical protein
LHCDGDRQDENDDADISRRFHLKVHGGVITREVAIPTVTQVQVLPREVKWRAGTEQLQRSSWLQNVFLI